MRDTAKIYQPNKKQSSQPIKKSEPTAIEKDLNERRELIDKKVADMPTEYGGRSTEKGLEPTRYDDWEMKGRCIDF